MTAVAPPRAPDRASAGGGLPARRALVRWSWRLLCREWRSQVLVTLLLTLAVTTAVCGGTALYNTPPPSTPQLGSAEHRLKFAATGPGAVAANIASLRAAFGTIDVIGHSYAKAPGLTTPVEYRAQDPHGHYTGPLLAIHSGRSPSGANEAAVTDGVAQLLGLRLGGTIALDGHPRRIVGIAEDPNDLNDEFVLVPPAGGPPPQSVSVLYDGAGETRGRMPTGTPLDREDQPTGPTAHEVATTLVLGAATILLLLVAFVAAAGFAVLAHRRLRQLGMLAAIGATQRQVRLVMSANGFLIGIIAAAIGTAAGLLLWFPAAQALEPAVNHRIDRFDLPWFLIAGLIALAVVMSTGAAWWPARVVSRLPVTAALSGRPPAPRPSHRTALLSAVFLVVGVGCLAMGQKKNPPLIIAGTIATALAIFFAAPLAIGVLAAAASRAPVAVRLALRDLARHRARSAAAVAAISLALGIPVATVIIATSAQATPTTGNLNDRQMLIQFPRPSDGPPSSIPKHTAQELRDLDAQADRIAGALTHPAVIPLDMAVDPAAPPPPDARGAEGSQEAVQPGIPKGPRSFEGVPAYVATPELLRSMGVDPAELTPGTDVITGRTEALVFPKMGPSRGVDHPAITRVHAPGYTSLPTTLVTQGGLDRRHWTRIRAGWLIESQQPLTRSQIAAARTIAANAGLDIETRNGQQALGTVRASATAGGTLLALGILAMTVGLIRSESAADLRTLTATGANATIRRTLTAATAGGLALLGVVLGTVGACLGLLAAYRHDIVVFDRVPAAYPVAILLGVPLAAFVTGWLLAGKEPPAIARRMSE